MSWTVGTAQGAAVKYWEIIADNLSDAGWSWGCVATVDARGRTIWIADAHRGDGKRLVVHADEKLSAFLGTTSGDSSSARIVTKRRSRRIPPMLNSARWHCTSPRRGRGVEWSDQRWGIRFHFRPRRFCRRCASDASQESVGNAGSIDVTTSDIPLRTDSVKRCKG